MKFYELHVAGLVRQLPMVKLSEDLSIASFVLLGDQEMTTAAARALEEKLPQFDILVTAEAKGIPLVHELARLRNQSRYIVARKSQKAYMETPVKIELESITTAGKQVLFMDEEDRKRVEGKRVAIVDDVISTGASLKALETLVEKVGGEIVAKAAILAEGDAKDRSDIIFLEPLPTFK